MNGKIHVLYQLFGSFKSDLNTQTRAHLSQTSTHKRGLI